jgi:poly-beta-1,6-N-acetyl-D-glucosamine synthase
MTTYPPYAVITPVRNEESNFPSTVKSFVSQTHLPARWVIVDDGSTDRTGLIANEAAKSHSWIRVVHRKDRGYRKPGTGVVEAFNDGYAHLADIEWEYLGKIDGDLAFEPDLFIRCFDQFRRDSTLGIAGGLVCRQAAAGLVAESRGDPAFHVRGATKVYRKQCWEQIGGLFPAPGWDTLDELKANMLGWSTRTLNDLKIHQLKGTGTADGAWRNWVKNGIANYITGYHPLFMFAKCLKRLPDPPTGIPSAGLAWGYFSALIRGTPRFPDQRLIAYVREQQIRKLFGEPSIW